MGYKRGDRGEGYKRLYFPDGRFLYFQYIRESDGLKTNYISGESFLKGAF